MVANLKTMAGRLAKTSRPNLTDVVSRERLYAAIDKGRDKSIIWVSGPPGSGKTTLIANYLDQRELYAVWYQMDAGDADIATFVHYLSQTLSADDEAQTLPTFQPDYLADPTVYSARYFREFFARLEPPFALVFDNYQDVPLQSRLHEAVYSGLAEVPEGGCVIFISRLDPPPLMARLQANSKMQLLGWDDLKLTREESDAIVALRGYRHHEPARQQLYERTQGWAAGVVLMLEAMRAEGTVADMPTTFTPTVIFDYLAGEIFRKFEAPDQEFLLRTGVLPQVTASMAGELTGRDDAATLLAYLTGHDYLVTATRSGDEVVYQYHPLLRDFLRSRAVQTLTPQEYAQLRTQAARQLETTGHIEDATRLRIENAEWPELKRLIRTHAPAMLGQGRGETLEQWLEELPQEELDTDPWLLSWLGACRFPFAPRESRRLNERAYRMFKEQPDPDRLGLFESCASVLEALLNDLDDLTLVDPWIEEVEQLLLRYPDFPTADYGAKLTYNTYLALVLRQPFHAQVERWGERTFDILRNAKEPALKVRSAICLVSGIAWTGRAGRSLEIIELIRKLADAPDVSPITLTTLRQIESMHYMLVGDYEACMAVVKDGVAIANASGAQIWKNSIVINGVGGALGAGDLDTAEQLLSELDTREMAGRRFDSCLYHYYLAWRDMLRGNVLDAFHNQRAALRFATEIGAPFFEILCRLALAQILFACGDQRKGANLLHQIRTQAGSIRNRLLEFTCFLAYAKIALGHGREASGLRALKYALGVGREYRFMHTIWWQPREMADLAVAALEHDIETDYVRQLIIRRQLVPSSAPLHVQNWPWQYTVHTLGRYSMQLQDAADGPRTKRGGRPVELLKAAIAFGARDVAVEKITDALWPNIEADYAHRSFNTTLHRLRKSLGNDRAVIFREGKVSLDAGSFWLDTWALDDVISSIGVALRDAGRFVDHQHVMLLVGQALDLYQGAFLEGESGTWVIAAREYWKSRFVRLVGDVVDYLRGAEREHDCVDFLYRALEADRLSESLYRQLMILYQQMERRAEAIEIYNRCRTTLAAELDIEPSPETSALYERLVTGH